MRSKGRSKIATGGDRKGRGNRGTESQKKMTAILLIKNTRLQV